MFSSFSASVLHPSERIDELFDLCEQLHRDDPGQALAVARKALALSTSMNDSSRIARSLYFVGTFCFCCSSYTDALVFLDDAYRLFGELGQEIMQVKVLHVIAAIHAEVGENQQALEIFLPNLAVFTRLADDKWIASTLNYIGAIRDKTGDYSGALEAYYKALEHWEQIDSGLHVGICYNNIATVYCETGDYEKALQYHMKALSFRQQYGDRVGEAITLKNIGEVSCYMDRLHEALEYLMPAVRKFHALGVRDKEAGTWNILGNVYEKLDEVGLAAGCYRQALAIMNSTGNKDLIGSLYAGIGRLFGRRKYTGTAILYVEKALAVAVDTGDRPLQYAVCHELAGLCEQVGDVQRALVFYKQYASVKEEVIGREQQRIISEMETRFHVEKAEKEKEIYRLKSEQLELEMKYRSRELASTALYLVQKNELLKQLNNRIAAIIRSRATIRTSELRVLLQPLQIKEAEGREWQLFERQFEHVYRDFSRKILALHSSLTAMEMRICVFLAMNLSSKDIASLLCLSVRTVNCHRYNIRKKIGLPSAAGLPTYLASL